MSAARSRGPCRGLRARLADRARRLARGRGGRDRRAARPERRRQVDAGQGDRRADADLGGPRAFRWRRRDAAARASAHRRRTRLHPANRERVRRNERRRQSARRRRRHRTGRAPDADRGDVHDVPRSRPPARVARRPALRRPAADAGDRPRAVGRAEGADARRTLRRPVAEIRRGGVRQARRHREERRRDRARRAERARRAGARRPRLRARAGPEPPRGPRARHRRRSAARRALSRRPA